MLKYDIVNKNIAFMYVKLLMELTLNFTKLHIIQI